MTLDELQQIKDSLDKGVIVSKPSWLEVLDWAVELTKHHERRVSSDSFKTAMQIIAEGRKIYEQKIEEIHARNDS